MAPPGLGALLLLGLTACSRGEPVARVEQSDPPAVGQVGSTPPAAYRALVARFRSEEEPVILQSPGPAVARASWDRLVITAKDGSRHVFADEVVGDELRWAYLFGGYFEAIDAYVVEKRHVPEGWEFLLLEAGTGRTTRVDALPVPSPGGARFVTASLDLVAGHLPNRIRVYRMEESGPVLEWEVEPREWGARNAEWLDERTLRLERAVMDWSTHELRTSPMLLRREPGGWTVEPLHAPVR